MGKWISLLFGIITLDMEIGNVNRLENFFEINIPLFHHSIVPCGWFKSNAIKNPFISLNCRISEMFY